MATNDRKQLTRQEEMINTEAALVTVVVVVVVVTEVVDGWLLNL